jgi:hypothetical protein
MSERLGAATAGIWILLAGSVFFPACGGDGKDVKVPRQEIDMPVPDTSGLKGFEGFDAAVADRENAGDTIAIDHKLLQALLTDTIPGHDLEINKSSTFKTNDFAFSEATKVFYNSEENYTELTAGDYVSNPEFFKVNIQRYNIAQDVEINGIRDKKLDVPGLRPEEASDFFTWSSYNSRKRLAWVFIGVNFRYFVTIEATNQDGFIDLERVKGWLNWKAIFAKPS